jgi:alpha-L-fucosidase
MVLLLGLVVLPAGRGAGAEPAWPPAKPEAIRKWQEMRFGMFIHWGPVSLKGTEIGWSRGAEVPIEEYDNLYKHFNPTKFNAEAWVSIAKAAGMKYIVITSKHHDGFCLWDTKQTDYNIMNSALGRDVLKELAAACRKQGIAFATYYSVTDWHHPAHPLGSPGGQTRKPHPDIEAYTTYLKNQVGELIRNYGPLAVMWFDVPQAFDARRGADLIAYVRSLQPDIIVNNRSGAGGDYDTPEQQIGRFQNHRPWETCMTICQQWAWKPGDQMKSLQECLQTLITCAGGDGNLLFNVGPMPSGEIEPRQVARLKEMGAWLSRYGESIYGTRGGPFLPGKGLVSTRRGQRIYVHVLRWQEEPLCLPGIPKKIVQATVLTGGSATLKQDAQGITISVPAAHRQQIDTIVCLELDGPAEEIAPIALEPGPPAPR